MENRKLKKEIKVNVNTFHVLLICIFGFTSVYMFMNNFNFSLGYLFINIMWILSILMYLIQEKN